MAKQCRVVRSNDSQIQSVKTEQGNDSALFNSLNNIIKEPNTSLEYYAISETEAFKEVNQKSGILLNQNISVKDSTGRKGIVPISELERFIGEDRVGKASMTNSRETINKLKKDIFVNGFKEPIIVIYDKFSNNGEASIVEGNHRIVAAKELGFKEIPVTFEKGTLRTNEARKKDNMFPLNRVFIGIIDDNRGVKGRDLGLTVRQPRAEDYFNEPTPKQLFEFNNSFEKAPLSSQETVELQNAILSTGVGNSTELYESLYKALVNRNGIITFNEDKLKTMYNSFEIARIMSSPELQQTIKQAFLKLKNTPEITLDYNNLFVLPTSTSLNIFGKQINANPYTLEKEIDQAVAGVGLDNITESLTPNALDKYITNSEFKQAVDEKQSTLRTVPLMTVLNGELVQKEDNIANYLPLTIINEANEELTQDIEFLNLITPQRWQENREDVQEIIENIVESVKANGIDLRDFAIRTSNMTREEILSFLSLMEDVLENPTEENQAAFVSSYNTILKAVNLLEDTIVSQNEFETSIDTDLSEYEMLRDFNMVKKADGVYRKVTEQSLEELYSNFFQNNTGKNLSDTIIPYSSIKEKVYHGSDNKIIGDFRNMNPNIDGFFFSSDISNARTYGKNITEVYLDIRNPLIIESNGLKFTDDIPVTVIASYRNELPYETVISLPIDEIVYMVKNGKRSNQLIEIKDREKYDGIVFKNLIDPSLSSKRSIPQDTIVAFKNSQIKKEYNSIEDLTYFVQQKGIQQLNISDFNVDTEILEKMYLYKTHFDFPLNTAPVEIKTNNLYKVTLDENYLTDDFVREFNRFALQTQNDYFTVNEKGIQISSNDPITTTEALINIPVELLDQLAQYNLVSKNLNLDLQPQEPTFVSINSKLTKRQEAVNNPELVKKLTGEYTYIEDGVMAVKNENEDFVRTPNGIYEMVYEQGNIKFYGQLPDANPNYILTNIQSPLSNVDYNNYLYLEDRPDLFKQAKNYYTKKELEQINQENFNCQ